MIVAKFVFLYFLIGFIGAILYMKVSQCFNNEEFSTGIEVDREVFAIIFLLWPLCMVYGLFVAIMYAAFFIANIGRKENK